MPEKTPTACSIQYRQARIRSIVATVGLVTTVTATLVLVATMVWRSRLGFDFTDEGYYLNFIANPRHFPVSPTQFAYIYHPLYRSLGQDIVALRQGNILISFCLAVVLNLCLLRCIGRQASTGGSWLSAASVATSIVAASSALIFVNFTSALWLPTPGYNSLIFQSLLIASIGLCLAEAQPSPASAAGWILIGVGGGLAFMAKPTSAAALGVLMPCSLTLAGKLNWRLLIVSILTCVLLVSALAWAIDASIIKFVEDLLQSVGTGHILLGDRGDILRVDPLDLHADDLIALAGLTVVLVLLLWINGSERRGWSIAGGIAILVCAAISLALVLGLLSPAVPATSHQGLQFLALIFAPLLCVAWPARRKCGASASRQRLSLAVFFAALPFVYVFGSTINYWLASQSAVFFWTLSGIAIMAPARPETDAWRRLSPLATVALAMTAVFVYRGMTTPYRQTHPLVADTEAVQTAGPAGRLLVSPDFASYINEVLGLSRDAGFTAGTPVIDLTGHYPGMLYLMAAMPAGAPWLIGGYPGSKTLAEKYLDRAACDELAGSWILTEPDGPRKLSPALLTQYGIDIQRDFAVVAVVDAPTASFPKSYKQQLLKPVRSRQDAVLACEAARARKE
ncbi:MAG: hypothetical protein QOH32_45 [Bradyrhizobium sp.]|jgi:hypothetical protein|nr:hypothetical protein [Bradyrhizobium sp.]